MVRGQNLKTNQNEIYDQHAHSTQKQDLASWFYRVLVSVMALKRSYSHNYEKQYWVQRKKAIEPRSLEESSYDTQSTDIKAKGT